jgi:cytochrome bd-type quinol oxidase subunit 2
MSNVKISDLDLASSIAVDDNFVLVHSNVTQKTTAQRIFDTAVATNSLATTTYVDTAISNLISGAPSALNTLNELAQALNGDASFASHVATQISTINTALGTKFNSADFGATADTWLVTKTTNGLAEGTSHLYYTDARARAALSHGTAIVYNSTTGVIGFDPTSTYAYTDAKVH